MSKFFIFVSYTVRNNWFKTFSDFALYLTYCRLTSITSFNGAANAEEGNFAPRSVDKVGATLTGCTNLLIVCCLMPGPEKIIGTWLSYGHGVPCITAMALPYCKYQKGCCTK
jgi:hypothetical protein